MVLMVHALEYKNSTRMLAELWKTATKYLKKDQAFSCSGGKQELAKKYPLPCIALHLIAWNSNSSSTCHTLSANFKGPGAIRERSKTAENHWTD